ncbi:hypothetical protein [uncultured Draconibacterium sp.]|uniref:hypothetical protein n=1 Tax=uncultured Draconibacterium sp. TaxID=1573823 RepID=UPI00321660AA
MQKLIFTLSFLLATLATFAQGTRLLRQPTLSKTHIAFTYGGDVWVSNLATQQTTRLTSTAAVESNPHFSPDGKNHCVHIEPFGINSCVHRSGNRWHSYPTHLASKRCISTRLDA